jgi:hypothetical protein
VDVVVVVVRTNFMVMRAGTVVVVVRKHDG